MGADFSSTSFLTDPRTTIFNFNDMECILKSDQLINHTENFLGKIRKLCIIGTDFSIAPLLDPKFFSSKPRINNKFDTWFSYKLKRFPSSFVIFTIFITIEQQMRTNKYIISPARDDAKVVV